MKKLVTKAILLLFLLVSFSLSTSAQVAWVWGNDPTATAQYTPNTLYQFNSTGADNTISRFEAGLYRVEFPGLKDIPNPSAHVVAENSNHTCNIDWVGASTNGTTEEHVFVRCFAPDGTQADTLFDLLLFSETRTGDSWDNAHLTNLNPTPGTTDTHYYSYNSKGGKNIITQLGTGYYRVTLEGISRTGGTVMVSPIHQSERRYCTTHVWFPSANNTEIYLSCFNKDGNKTDTGFTLSYRRDLYFGQNLNEDTFHYTYLWAGNASPTAPYTPNSLYKHNTASSEDITIEKTDTGFYKVRMPGIDGSKTGAMITAYGDDQETDNTYCNINSWVPYNTNAGTDFWVECYNASGTRTDSQFSLQFFTNTSNGTLTATEKPEVPTQFELSEVYPNPFNPTASFTLSLTQSENITIKVYNTLGQEVKTLQNGLLTGNQKHTFTLDATNLTSGVYLIQVQGDSFKETRVANLVK